MYSDDIEHREGGEERSVVRYDVDGQQRWAIFRKRSSRVLLLVLHGSKESRNPDEDAITPALGFEEVYDERYFESHRREHGYSIVYLAARRTDSGWYCWENNGEEFGTCAYHVKDGNDVAFVTAVMDDFRQSDDSVQVYGLGFSGGAKFLWKYRDLFHGVAPIAGALAPSLRQITESSSHYCTPVVAFHGDQDSFEDISSARESIDWYERACACQRKRVHEISETITLHRYSSCGTPATSYIHFYELKGVGHVIPGAPLVWSGLGATSDFDSLEVTWAAWQTQGSAVTAPVISDSAAERAQSHLLPFVLIAISCIIFWGRS